MAPAKSNKAGVGTMLLLPRNIPEVRIFSENITHCHLQSNRQISGQLEAVLWQCTCKGATHPQRSSNAGVCSKRSRKPQM
jgi:hypothetical protein